MGSDRTLAVSCYDGAGPRSLGRFSARFGTPLRVNVHSGVISSAVSVAWILFCTIQILFPGLGDEWFGDDYRPGDEWVVDERWTYLFTELVPLVVFTAIAVAFWWIGRRELADGREAVTPARH